MKIYTIGYGNDLNFTEKLPKDIQLVIDVRRDCTAWCKSLNTPLRNMDVTKVKSIKKLINDAGFKYIHLVSLGNNCQTLDEYAEWLKAESNIEMLCYYIFYKYSSICLLCAEKEAIKDGQVKCHRVYIAEFMHKWLENLESAVIIHL